MKLRQKPEKAPSRTSHSAEQFYPAEFAEELAASTHHSALEQKRT
jgi:hypothetical protein